MADQILKRVLSHVFVGLRCFAKPTAEAHREKRKINPFRYADLPSKCARSSAG
jgi:hypothetical protein